MSYLAPFTSLAKQAYHQTGRFPHIKGVIAG
jgi:hypothetical protein